jgi:outer membrane protein TolC
MNPSRILAVMALSSLAGCSVGPDYHAPAVAVPPTFGGAVGQAAPDIAAWWHAFNDPVLDGLIARGLQGNLDIRQAAARVEQARAQERATRANGGPRVNASAQGGYNQLSSNSLPSALTNLGNLGGGSGGSALGLAGEHFTTFQTGFDASWEIDLFGGQRRANEAARARTDASIWSRRDAQVTLVAEIATTYQRYRALQGRIAIMDETITAQRDEQDTDRVRAARGLTTTLDERQRQARIAQSTATREDLVAQAQGCVHALGTLLGLAPDGVAGDLARAPKGAPGAIEVPPACRRNCWNGAPICARRNGGWRRPRRTLVWPPPTSIPNSI